MPSWWRDRARQVIAGVIREHGSREDTPELRRKLRAAYPFGERAMHPYKIWCDEVNKNLGKKKSNRDRDRQRSIFPSPASAPDEAAKP
ncbi:MAG: hypothetical protein ABIJ57_10960 [Pseudomonadota bacterium]